MSDAILGTPLRKRGIAAVLPPEESRRHFAAMGRKSNADRVILSGDETRALGEAYALLRRIAQRHPTKLSPDRSTEADDPADEAA